MTRNLLLGLVMLVACVLIQCFVVSLLLRILAALRSRQRVKPRLTVTTFLLTGVMLVMVTGNMCQVALWASLFIALGEFRDFATAFYFSVVNFTTLGYGDLVMSEQSRLLGAFEAGNGVLMLGLTTSVLFLVLNTAVQQAWDEQFKEE